MCSVTSTRGCGISKPIIPLYKNLEMQAGFTGCSVIYSTSLYHLLQCAYLLVAGEMILYNDSQHLKVEEVPYMKSDGVYKPTID